MTYYNEVYDNTLIACDLQRLVNQIWKLLPMREHNEDWQKQLNLVLIEVRGLKKMFGDQLDFVIILSKLEGLDDTTDLMIYRSVIFSIISAMTDLIAILNVRKS